MTYTGRVRQWGMNATVIQTQTKHSKSCDIGWRKRTLVPSSSVSAYRFTRDGKDKPLETEIVIGSVHVRMGVEDAKELVKRLSYHLDDVTRNPR